jgi:hypothetical protein
MSDGAVGEIPHWYALIQAAKYYGVAPWVLAEQGIWWQDMALICMDAEARAREFYQRQASKHAH